MSTRKLKHRTVTHPWVSHAIGSFFSHYCCWNSSYS